MDDTVSGTARFTDIAVRTLSGFAKHRGKWAVTDGRAVYPPEPSEPLDPHLPEIARGRQLAARVSTDVRC